MRWSKRIFQLFLFAYPRRIRTGRETDMWLTFQSHLRDARIIGCGAVLGLWRREIGAMVRDGLRARVGEVRRSRARQLSRTASTMRDPLLGVSYLDFKLGVRMLVKYPGLTLVGGLGMATAIGIGVGFFGFAGSYTDTTLPFDEGNRVVSIQNWNVESDRAQRLLPYDILTWREAATLDDVGAAVQTRANLITEDGRIEFVRQAQVSAAGFRLTRVAPLMGRALIDADETMGSPPVVVLGFGIWHDVLASDPDVLGRRLQIGDTQHTIVGVMPEGFGFPVSEEIWTPLILDPELYEQGAGPRLTAFGRLANDATIQSAKSELTALAGQTAAAFPETHRSLRPRVMAYAAPFVDMDDPQMPLILNIVRTLMTLVLVIVCVNVAVLVYARTAMRLREIGVRTALGASRGRVVTQLFVEALVLSLGAAVVGVFGAHVAVQKIDAFQRAIQPLPFWMELELSWGSIVYAVGLTILAAAIVGVFPGLKATGRDVHTNLQRLGSSGLRGSLGGTWTFLIVSQVAIVVAALPITAYQLSRLVATRSGDFGFPADEILTVGPIRGETWLSKKDAASELFRRIHDDPLVRAVTYSRHNICCPQGSRIDVEGLTAPDEVEGSEYVGRFALRNDVGLDFFTTLDVPFLAGRSFNAGDVASDNVVVVNRNFVRRFLDGQSPLGMRLRHTRRTQTMGPEEADNRWYEIVGVVDNFVQSPNFVDAPTVYHTFSSDRLSEGSFAVRTRGDDVAPVATRIRQVGAAVDPTIPVAVSLRAEGLREDRRAIFATALIAYIGMFSVVLLSSAGIYALMSFTVTQRRREIGIRTALGGSPRSILMSIFSRAIRQVTTGIVVGVTLTAIAEMVTGNSLFDGSATTVLPIATLFMLLVGVMAAMGPARRGLRVQPHETLQDAD